MRRKTVLPVLAMAVLVLCLVTLASQGMAADTPRIYTLRVTYVKLPLNVPLIIMKQAGLLEETLASDAGGVEWLEITEGGKQIQALAAGSIDIASVVSSTAAITARGNGMDVKIVAAFSRSPRAFTIVAMNPAIGSVADLKGRTVAGPKGSLLNQTLFAALVKNGLKPSDVGYVHMPVPKALAALIGGSVDAALVAGPALAQAEGQGARILVTGEGLVKGLIVTAVTGSFLEQHGNLVKSYLRALGKALVFMQDNPDQSVDIVAKATGLGADEVRRMYPWYDFTPGIEASDKADLESTQQFLVESGMLSAPTDLSAMVTDMTR
ncbi:MAG: NrtA/SsuA/CpmA family ABC transporter substrate-binding protein [Pseudomonadota bacterium]